MSPINTTRHNTAEIKKKQNQNKAKTLHPNPLADPMAFTSVVYCVFGDGKRGWRELQLPVLLCI